MNERKPADSLRRTRRWAFVWMGLAVISGLGATALVGRTLKSRGQAGPEIQTVPVVVATRDISMGTTIASEHLRIVDFPKNASPKGGFSSPEAVLGRVPQTMIVSDEPIIESRLVPKEAGSGLTALIPEEMRAMAVKVNEVIGVAGFIHPNDFVDVIAVMPPEQGEEPHAKVILQRIRVLAVGQEMTSPNNKKVAQAVTVVTLLVTPAESESLALAATEGHIQLSLRSQIDERAVETPGTNPKSMLRVQPVVAVADPKPKAKKEASAKPEPKKESVEVVEVFHGKKLEERKIKPAAGTEER